MDFLPQERQVKDADEFAHEHPAHIALKQPVCGEYYQTVAVGVGRILHPVQKSGNFGSESFLDLADPYSTCFCMKRLVHDTPVMMQIPYQEVFCR